jgi:hypothetical protein
VIYIAVSKPILSRNQIDKMHWAKKSRESKEWEREIFAALNGKVSKAKGLRTVNVTSLRARELEDDNLIGGFKGGRDAIKRLGLIIDDNSKWCRFKYSQKVQKAGFGTIIEISEGACTD